MRGDFVKHSSRFGMTIFWVAAEQRRQTRPARKPLEKPISPFPVYSSLNVKVRDVFEALSTTSTCRPSVD